MGLVANIIGFLEDSTLIKVLHHDYVDSYDVDHYDDNGYQGAERLKEGGKECLLLMMLAIMMTIVMIMTMVTEIRRLVRNNPHPVFDDAGDVDDDDNGDKHLKGG